MPKEAGMCEGEGEPRTLMRVEPRTPMRGPRTLCPLKSLE